MKDAGKIAEVRIYRAFGKTAAACQQQDQRAVTQPFQ